MLALAALAAGQEAPIITIAPGQQVSCVVPDSSKSGWHFEICKAMITQLPPRSVPAVRKTRKVNLCGWSFDHVDCEHNGFREEQYWTCADPNRALIVSQNGKKAACLLVE